ncbi:MAG: fluoride efflux transporter CrcB [Actinomycetota bacterium]|nr:fluoride efflux transporter CrcB [Actinomycetota bacterium]
MTLGMALAVALGGFIGAPARFLMDRAISGRIESDLPWGTFIVNMSGSLLLGLLTGLDLNGHLGPVSGALAATGFCGAYTTFSTFTFETMRLIEEGDYLEAAYNVLGSIGVGLITAASGLAIGLAI